MAAAAGGAWDSGDHGIGGNLLRGHSIPNATRISMIFLRTSSQRRDGINRILNRIEATPGYVMQDMRILMTIDYLRRMKVKLKRSICGSRGWLKPNVGVKD